MLALRIALRYLLAPKSHKAVNVISLISMAGVAVAAMAIMVVLSVFNGFSDLASQHLALIDPDLRISPATGKVFGNADSVLAIVRAHGDVKAASPVLEERALLVSGERQMPVIFRGVDHRTVTEVTDMDSIIIDGVFADRSPLSDSLVAAQLSVGVALNTGLRPSGYQGADLYVPRRQGRINPANPAAAYRRLPFSVSGVFQVEQPEYDSEYLLIPLDAARQLLEYDNESGGVASSIEVSVHQGASTAQLEKALQQSLGDGFIVLDRFEQQSETFRMISVEKWITFIMLLFILLTAAFNIVSTLSLLVIEKRDNMHTLRALGAPHSLVSRIFITEGILITTIGGVVGTVLGMLLSLAQQHFGLIKLSGDPSALTTDTYPVHLMWQDVAMVIGAVILTGFIVGQISRFFTKRF